YGGYLIYRFNGQRKVYFDGRSDFYGAAFMKQYLVLITAQPGWQEIVKSYRFTHALLPNDSALKAALEQAGWTTLHKDNVATLLEYGGPPGPQPASWPARHLARGMGSRPGGRLRTGRSAVPRRLNGS